ncbi:MAG: DUF721 domain-containing protein [bacterium]
MERFTPARKKPKKLGNVLSVLIKNLGIETKVKQYSALNNWPEIVGKKVAGVTSVEKIHDGIIYVKVKNNAWRTELVYMKKEILTKITESVGKKVITDIWFI